LLRFMSLPLLISMPDFSSLLWGLILFLIFGAAGIALAIIGYRLFDKFTPGDLHEQIFEHKNVAAAVLAASVILGLSLILAAAMGS
jgi:uncharacterized membrane protein YjfL (UPF0719 family)